VRANPEKATSSLVPSFPAVVGGEQRGVRLIFLARVERVAHILAKSNRNQVPLVRDAIISDAVESDLVPADLEDALRVQLEHLAMLEILEQTVAVVGFECYPLPLGQILRCESSRHIKVAIVACEGDKSLRSAGVAGRWRQG